MGYVGVIDNRTLQINCLSLFFNFLIRMQRWYDGDEWRGCSRHSARYMHLKYELYSSTSNSFVFNLLLCAREYNISKYLWSKQIPSNNMCLWLSLTERLDETVMMVPTRWWWCSMLSGFEGDIWPCRGHCSFTEMTSTTTTKSWRDNKIWLRWFEYAHIETGCHSAMRCFIIRN